MMMMMGHRKMMRTMRRSMKATSMIAAGVVGIGIATAVYMGMRSRHM